MTRNPSWKYPSAQPKRSGLLVASCAPMRPRFNTSERWRQNLRLEKRSLWLADSMRPLLQGPRTQRARHDPQQIISSTSSTAAAVKALRNLQSRFVLICWRTDWTNGRPTCRTARRGAHQMVLSVDAALLSSSCRYVLLLASSYTLKRDN